MDIANTLKAIIILDATGQKAIAKYFDPKTSSQQFERKLFVKSKSQKIKDEILTVDGMLIVHRYACDLHLYVVGNRNENPLILDSVLNCIVEVINSMLNKNVGAQSLREHLTEIILAMDEICENGLILETDSNLVLERVSLKDELMEQSYAQKIQSATEHIRFPWLRS